MVMEEAIRPLPPASGNSNVSYVRLVERVDFPRPLWLVDTFDLLHSGTNGLPSNRRQGWILYFTDQRWGGQAWAFSPGSDMRKMLCLLGLLLSATPQLFITYQ